MSRANYQREYRSKNRVRIAAGQHDRYRSTREYVTKQKEKPCMDCGVQYPPYVMDFDHVRGEKLFTIGVSVARSLPKLIEEIAKCDLVCSNCHRERTFGKRKKAM